MDLGRLLVGRTTSKTALIHNVSPLTIAWRVAAPQSLDPALQIAPLSGHVLPHQDCSITATFTAAAKGAIKQNVVIEVRP